MIFLSVCRARCRPVLKPATSSRLSLSIIAQEIARRLNASFRHRVSASAREDSFGLQPSSFMASCCALRRDDKAGGAAGHPGPSFCPHPPRPSSLTRAERLLGDAQCFEQVGDFMPGLRLDEMQYSWWARPKPNFSSTCRIGDEIPVGKDKSSISRQVRLALRTPSPRNPAAKKAPEVLWKKLCSAVDIFSLLVTPDHLHERIVLKVLRGDRTLVREAHCAKRANSTPDLATTAKRRPRPGTWNRQICRAGWRKENALAAPVLHKSTA